MFGLNMVSNNTKLCLTVVTQLTVVTRTSTSLYILIKIIWI